MDCTVLTAFITACSCAGTHLCLQSGHVPWQKAPDPAHAAAAVKGALRVPDEPSQGSHLHSRMEENELSRLEQALSFLGLH